MLDSENNSDPIPVTTSCKAMAICAFIPIVGFFFGAAALVCGVVAVSTESKPNLAARAMGLAGLGVFLQLVVSTVFFPSLGRARELPKRAICGANLNSIGKAIALYQSEWDDSFPWIVHTRQNVSLAEATARPTGGADTLDGLGRKTRNIVENLNALIALKMCSYKVFRCPVVGSDIAEERLAGEEGYNNVYGFVQLDSPGGDTKYYCDYSYHIGYPVLSGITNPAPTNDEMDGGFALMADADVSGHNPPTLSRAWNHKTDGVNVLMASFSVSWVTPHVEEDNSGKTYYPLIGEDNIYGDGGPDVGLGDPRRDQTPKDEQDQVLHSPK